jgi:hypothetical protein
MFQQITLYQNSQEPSPHINYLPSIILNHLSFNYKHIKTGDETHGDTVTQTSQQVHAATKDSPDIVTMDTARVNSAVTAECTVSSTQNAVTFVICLGHATCSNSIDCTCIL